MDSKTKITYRCGHSTIKTEKRTLLSAFFRPTRTGNKKDGGLCIKCQPRRRAPPARGTSQTIEAIANAESVSAITRLQVAQGLGFKIASLTKNPNQIVEPSLADHQITALYEVDLERADQLWTEERERSKRHIRTVRDTRFGLWTATEKPSTSLLWTPGTQVTERTPIIQPSVKLVSNKLDEPLFLPIEKFPRGTSLWQPPAAQSLVAEVIESEHLDPQSYGDGRVIDRLRQRTNLPKTATIAEILSRTEIPSTLSNAERRSLIADLDTLSQIMENEIEEGRRKLAAAPKSNSARSLSPLSYGVLGTQEPQESRELEESIVQETLTTQSFEESSEQVNLDTPPFEKSQGQYNLVDARSERGQEIITSLRTYLSLSPLALLSEVRMTANRFLNPPVLVQRESGSRHWYRVVRLLSEDAYLRHFQFRNELNQIRWAKEDFPFPPEVSVWDDDDDDSIDDDLEAYTALRRDREGLKIIRGRVRKLGDPKSISGLRNECILESEVTLSPQEELERKGVELEKV
jgi:hypothetical protein